MHPIKIYRLVDPLDGITKYVGMTTQDLISRLCGHIHHSTKKKTDLQIWLFNLISNNILPQIVLIEAIPSLNSSRVERSWIKKYRKENSNLFNISNGGKGVSLYGEKHPHSKISDAQVIELKTLYSTGKYTQQSLADWLGMTRGAIGRILNNKKRNFKTHGKTRINAA